MSIAITIRDVPDDTKRELAARAAASGRSLQEYLRSELIKLASKPDIHDLMRRVKERLERAGSSLSAEEILRLRDADRK